MVKEIRDVQLVVVHGMGKQRSSETLLEWAEPLLRRIDWIARSDAHRLSDEVAITRSVAIDAGLADRFDDEILGDLVADVAAPATSTEAPPTAELPEEFTAKRASRDDELPERSVIQFGAVVAATDGDGEVEAEVLYRVGDAERTLRLRITEARWSESFLGMSRSEVFAWGLGFSWRTIRRLGLHFSRVMWFGSRHLRWLYAVPAAVTVGLLWALLSLVGAVATVFLVLVGPLLFLPLFASALESIVDTLVEFVGDVGVWTRRPVRAAAMREVVRAELVSAYERKLAAANTVTTRLRSSSAYSSELHVVAHSQGAAVTASTLFSIETGESRPPVDSLVTVGAAVTLLGVSSWTGRLAPAPEDDVQAARPRNIVRAWAKGPATVWLNFWAIWDPFSTGPISTGPQARRSRWFRGAGVVESASPYLAAIGPEEHAVHNSGWPFGDHQGYSSNFVQVIDPVARRLMNVAPEYPQPVSAPFLPPVAGTAGRRNESHARSVRELGVQRLLVLGLAISVVALPWLFERVGVLLTRYLPDLSEWIAKAFELEPAKGFFAWLSATSWFLPAVVAVAIASIGLWLNTTLWRRFIARVTWNDADRVPLRWHAGWIFRFALILILLVLIAVGLAAGGLSWGDLVLAVVALFIAVLAGFGPYWGSPPQVVVANRDELRSPS